MMVHSGHAGKFVVATPLRLVSPCGTRSLSGSTTAEMSDRAACAGDRLDETFICMRHPFDCSTGDELVSSGVNYLPQLGGIIAEETVCGGASGDFCRTLYCRKSKLNAKASRRTRMNEKTRFKGDSEMRITLRPQEAAVALGVSDRTLYGLLRSGDIPHSRVRRAILIRIADIEAYLNQSRCHIQSETSGNN